MATRKVIGTPGNSPALQFEIRLAEAVSRNGHSLTTERADLSFAILDELLPYLGVYHQVMRMLREELYKAVYSKEFTSRSNKKKKSDKPAHVPYFVVAKRCIEDCDKQSSKLKLEIESLKEQLYTCEADLEKASSTVEAFKHDLRERDLKIQKLTMELSNALMERDQLKSINSHDQQVQENLIRTAENNMKTLKVANSALSTENSELMKYKTAYESIQKSFQITSTTATACEMDTPHLPKFISAISHELSAAQSLKMQLLSLQNTLISEYENFMNGQLLQLKGATLKSSVRKCRKSFSSSMTELLSELQLLEEHTTALESRQLEVQNMQQERPQDAIVQSNHPATPLVVQEQLLNKYSIMLHASSDNGITFYPLKEGRNCLSCGSKTVSCPHKSFQAELLVQLPLNTTHIKLARPSLKVPLNQKQMSKAKLSFPVVKNTVKIMDLNERKIWDHFERTYNRKSSDRTTPRCLSFNDVLLLAKLFCCNEVINQEAPPPDGSKVTVSSSLTSLYQFMTKHYHVPVIAPLAITDFIASLVHYHQTHMVLHMLAHVLAGTFDIVIIHYFLLQAELVDLLPWSSPQECQLWANTLYPFLEDEEVEQYCINFVSYCGNQISKHTAADYMCLGILKCRDPLVMKVESQLADQQTQKACHMTEAEYAEACLSLCSSAPYHLQQRLFLQSLAQVGAEEKPQATVPVSKLAYCVAYLKLLETLPELTNTLAASARGLEYNRQQQTVTSDPSNELIKMSSVKSLSQWITMT